MKKIYIPIFVLILAGLSSCVSEKSMQVDEPGQEYHLDILGEISQEYVTRANDGGFCAGDAVGVFAVNYAGGEPGELQDSGNQVDNVKYTLGDDGKWTSSISAAFKDRNTHADIIGYYPYVSTVGNVAACPFEVKKDQSAWPSGAGMSNYEASDFLWACTADVAPSNGIVDLSFKHRMASMSITLVEGTGWGEGEWSGVSKSVLVTNVSQDATIDMRSGSVTVTGTAMSTGIIPQTGSGDSWRAIVVPQTVPAGKAVVSVTVDGRVKSLVKDLDYEYYPGRMNTMALSVNKDASPEGIDLAVLSEGILAWENDGESHDAANQEYIIISCPEPGKLSEAITEEGYDLSKITQMKVVGQLDDNDFALIRNNMTSLKCINLHDCSNEVIPFNAFYDMSSLNKVVFPYNLTEIGAQSFYHTSLTGSLVIPEGVTSIGFAAFCGDGSLTGPLELPSTLQTIDNSAFFRCESLNCNLILPEGLKSIGDYAFSFCYHLTGELHLPESLESLGTYAFQSTAFTGSLSIPGTINIISMGAFSNCKFDGSLTINKGATVIDEAAFNNNSFCGELVIPEGIKQIKEQAFWNNRFSHVVLPTTLKNIGNRAFELNDLSGTIEFPASLTAISSSAFRYCSSIEGVSFPASIEFIGENAFSECWNIGSIICKAQDPPEVKSGAFDGIPKDNFAIEVPESSIASYANAIGWLDFMRITSYRNFGFSRRQSRFLNNESSITLVMRAPSSMEWEITDIPDWVTVSPVSGKGKMEVTIRVSELEKGSGNRECELSCYLLEHDNVSTTKIQQYDYQYSDGDVVATQTHSKGKGVKLVFMGDCYDAKDISEGKYLDNINQGISYLFDIEPYKSYKDYFDVYTVIGLSEDSGVGTVNTIKSACFGSQYTVSEGVSPDISKCIEYASKAPIGGDIPNTAICIILNTTEYDGRTFLYADGTSISLCPMSGCQYPYDYRGVIQHEFGGHAFGKLGDENIIHNTFIQSCGCQCCNHVDEFNRMKELGWYDNLSLSGDFKDVPWSHMIYDPQYSDYVDVYEGGYYHNRGVFRSEENSCMNNHVPYYSAISRESIVKRIMSKAGEAFLYDDFKTNDIKSVSSTDTKSQLVNHYSAFVGAKHERQPKYMGEKVNN